MHFSLFIDDAGTGKKVQRNWQLVNSSYGRSADWNFMLLMSTATKILMFSVHNLIKFSYISLYSV